MGKIRSLKKREEKLEPGKKRKPGRPRKDPKDLQLNFRRLRMGRI